MEGVNHVVGVVLDRCTNAGIEVSEALAALTARSVRVHTSLSLAFYFSYYYPPPLYPSHPMYVYPTHNHITTINQIIHDNLHEFPVDEKMSDEKLSRLIEMCVERLGEKDSPSLETLKMQIAFDTTNSVLKTDMSDIREAQQSGIEDLHRQIVNANVLTGDEFENLSNVYRDIFSCLMFTYQNLFDPSDRITSDREVAAAMESVFPRVTLKSFMTMQKEEKRTQLSELSCIVLGIMLFNRTIGKGGSFILDLPIVISEKIRGVKSHIEQCIRDSKKECESYINVMRYVRTEKTSVSKTQLDRWCRELTNRRQLNTYAKHMLEDLRHSSGKISSAVQVLEREISELRKIVGSRNSVPKDVVYPKFDIVARNWILLSNENENIDTVVGTWRALSPFQNSLKRCLNAKLLALAERKALLPTKSSSKSSKKSSEESKTLSSSSDVAVEHTTTTTNTSSIEQRVEESKDSTTQASSSSSSHKAGKSGATLVTDRNSPEMSSLPVSLNRYCPITVVQENGLLLHGDVELGLVRYQNRFFLCENADALQLFMKNPSNCLDKIRKLALRQPELIDLLDLRKLFPDLERVRHVLSSNSSSKTRKQHPLLAPAVPTKRDVGTGTPVHFVEKHIDYKYKWNEWDLRREALRVANIRKAKTTSSQTNASHFRQNIETQVYLPKESGTQTGIDAGTNPPRNHRYITGLRGRSSEKMKEAGVRVLNLTYEL